MQPYMQAMSTTCLLLPPSSRTEIVTDLDLSMTCAWFVSKSILTFTRLYKHTITTVSSQIS
jgi:hypothetical protein